jgi:hypothetical protein
MATYVPDDYSKFTLPFMDKREIKTRNITASDTVKMLAKEGIIVTEKDAEVILDFLYFLAKLTVNQYFNENVKKQVGN